MSISSEDKPAVLTTARDFTECEQAEERARLLSLLVQNAHDIDLEVRHRHKNGSWRRLEGLDNDLPDDPSERGIVLVSRDIIERKHAEDTLSSRTRSSASSSLRRCHESTGRLQQSAL